MKDTYVDPMTVLLALEKMGLVIVDNDGLVSLTPKASQVVTGPIPNLSSVSSVYDYLNEGK